MFLPTVAVAVAVAMVQAAINKNKCTDNVEVVLASSNTYLENCEICSEGTRYFQNNMTIILPCALKE